jgi:hypothetical protein
MFASFKIFSDDGQAAGTGAQMKKGGSASGDAITSRE